MCLWISEFSSSASPSIRYNLNPDVPKTEGRRLFFDTHVVVQLLEENGEAFTKIFFHKFGFKKKYIYNNFIFVY